MNKTKIVSLTLVLILMLTLPASSLDNKFHRFGRLWERMEDSGIGSDCIWPAGYGFQENAVDIGHWIAVKNLMEPDGNVLPYYVAEGGTQTDDESEFNMPVSIKRYRRQAAPIVFVDGEEAGELWSESNYDYVNSDLMAEEMIESIWNTGAGVTITRNSYAWSQQNHYDYIILDYTLENTGEMDNVTGVDQTQTLEDVFFVFQFEPRFRAGEDVFPVHSVTRDDWAEFYGADPGDLHKILYAFDGKSLLQGGVQYDPRPSDGFILAPQYLGFGILHADKSPTDNSHWEELPNSVQWESYVGTPSHAGGILDSDMYNYISQGTIRRKANDNDPTTLASKHVAMSFGPYTMAPGEKVNIVLVETVGGISQAECQRIGALYKSGSISESEKDNMVATGFDSMVTEVGLAKWAFEQEYKVPEAPPAPDLTVESGPGKVTLKWSDVSGVADPHTGENDFAGYKVYRSEGRDDSTFTLIFTCGGSSGNAVTNEYIDREVRRGFAYYYYVTAYDDGSSNTWGIQPGQSFQSSIFGNRTRVAAHPVRAPENTVENVRVVPNPYNINSINLFTGERDKVLFVNLPPKGTIRIFSLSGDLVKTIEHISGTGDESWNLVTDSNQIVRSGLYIFHVEGLDESGGEMGSVTGKFSIVR